MKPFFGCLREIILITIVMSRNQSEVVILAVLFITSREAAVINQPKVGSVSISRFAIYSRTVGQSFVIRSEYFTLFARVLEVMELIFDLL